ncbi:ribosomal maturation YjgA family protein [Actinomadura fibrosa]|uniref:DUF2809 domain-containing protein n=1 Tax=Actinomadura fibrosa TaxID=111802 RepID=A0ABW2XYS2_9ACTN|nr:DUF2809 domain-containing protein [Actinomadura fibrosa]
MSITTGWTRLLMVVSAAGCACAAYAIRAAMDGPIEQYSGAAFSGAIVYTIVLFIRPQISPLTAGIVAIAYCWLIEFAQLTPLPGALSQRSWFVRQLLGAQFDLTDVAWYPIGIIPLAAAHWYVRASRRTRTNPVAAESQSHSMD